VYPFRNVYQLLGFFAGIGLFLFLLRTPLDPENVQVQRTAAVAALMACWWMTNAIPIAATSLVPLVLFPFLLIMPGSTVVKFYVNSSIFLFVGGFLLALAMQRWNLHRRIALTIVGIMGDRPQFLVLGFMVASAFLSAWISNTATAMMMVPIGMSVIALVQGEKAPGESEEAEEVAATGKAGGFGVVLMLGIAYACSIGGTTTPIGTPPNIAFQRLFVQFFPGAKPVDFAQWTVMAFPFALVFLVLAWVLLVFVIQRLPGEKVLGGRRVIREELSKLGKTSRSEWMVLTAFASAVLLWMFRSNIELPGLTIPGWAPALGLGTVQPDGSWKLFVDDGTVAILIGLLLFILPSGDRARPRLLDWPTAVRLPWGIVLLFGGGFALAGAFKESGLSDWVGGYFRALEGSSNVVVVAGVSTVMTFLTELTSNTATTETAIPILSSIAQEINVNPLLVLVPATLSASCAFMLPVATPPNAIAFGSGYITMGQMIRNGLVLNLVGILLVLAMMTFLAGPILGVDLSTLPVEWLVPPVPGGF
jgi:sodium-dependent dicarboxylate transporter 2/3/5